MGIGYKIKQYFDACCEETRSNSPKPKFVSIVKMNWVALTMTGFALQRYLSSLPMLFWGLRDVYIRDVKLEKGF